MFKPSHNRYNTRSHNTNTNSNTNNPKTLTESKHRSARNMDENKSQH